MKPPLYFDYAATTPADPRVVKKMTRFLAPSGIFGNPASRTHALGQEAERAVEDARAQVAALIGANPLEIVWTSGATESNNLAVKGAARCNREKGGHLVTVQTEHKAVLDPMRELEREGFEITRLAPNSAGLIDPAKFAAALRADTALASVMWVNNEIGVIQPIAELGKICRERGVIFHVDAAQAPGKVRIDVNAAGVDLLSLSAHKAYGPKGIGALYVRRKPRVELEAQIHGGGHERGLRSGTLPTHQIAGMGEAFHLAHQEFDAENARIRGLRDKLLDCVRGIEETRINGDLENRVPHNLNVSFGFVESESLILALPDVAVSTGSACTSASVEPSHVLQALGGGDDWAHSSIRFSLGRFTTEEEINFLTELLPARIAEMRALSPLWRKQAARAAGAR